MASIKIPKFVLENYSIEKRIDDKNQFFIWDYNVEEQNLHLVESKTAFPSLSKGWNENEIENSFMVQSLLQSLEQEFIPLYDHKFQRIENAITLNCDELNEVKRFLLSLLIRQNSKPISQEAIAFYNATYLNLTGQARVFKNLVNHSQKDRLIEEIKIILTTRFDQIPKHPNCTYNLFHYWNLLNQGNLGFWHSDQNVEYILPDTYLSTERDKLNRYQFRDTNIPVYSKAGYILKTLEKNANLSNISKNELNYYYHEACIYQENFWMFPLNPKMMITLIHPFFERIDSNNILKANRSDFIMPSHVALDILSHQPSLHCEEDYHFMAVQKQITYPVRMLNEETSLYINVLSLNNVITHFGFKHKNRIFKPQEEIQTFPSFKLNKYIHLYQSLIEGK